MSAEGKGREGIRLMITRRTKSYIQIVLIFATVWPAALFAQTAKLKVAYPTTIGAMSVLWVTKEARLFEKNGLAVELIYIAGSTTVAQAMLAKEIPISEIAIPAVIQADLGGADMVMLAGPNTKPGQKIMAKPEIKTPEALKGKKVGISRFGTSDDFLLRYALSQWNLRPDRDVPIIQLGGSPEILAGLASGTVDAGLLSSPLHLRAAKLGSILLADLSTIGIDYQGAGLVTTRSFVRDNPDTIRRYVRAYVEGLHRFKTDKSFSLKVLAKYTRINEPEVLEETYQHYAIRVMPKIPYPTIKGIQTVLDEIGTRNPKAKTLQPANFIDVTFLKELEQSGFIKNLYGE
jgi:NitT/TauT family transport system substrate-binding protein